MIELHEKNNAIYEHEQLVIDSTTGEVLEAWTKRTIKTSTEPDFIKIYYQTMLAFNQIHDIPVSFVLSLSKFLEWTNEGKPLIVTLNKRVKDIMCIDCNVKSAQINRYIKQSVNNGLLFRTEYRGVYEVNPFMVAKGKWESIKMLRTQFDFINGKWTKTIGVEKDENNQKED